MKNRQRITSADVPERQTSRWHKKVSERHLLAKNINELRSLRHFKQRALNAPPAIAIFVLMALAYVAGYITGSR